MPTVIAWRRPIPQRGALLRAAGAGKPEISLHSRATAHLSSTWEEPSALSLLFLQMKFATATASEFGSGRPLCARSEMARKLQSGKCHGCRWYVSPHPHRHHRHHHHATTKAKAAFEFLLPQTDSFHTGITQLTRWQKPLMFLVFVVLVKFFFSLSLSLSLSLSHPFLQPPANPHTAVVEVWI